MSHLVDTERPDMKVISVNRREAMDLVKRFTEQLAGFGSVAPGVWIREAEHQPRYYLAFQVEE